jgi:hypothetical protein
MIAPTAMGGVLGAVWFVLFLAAHVTLFHIADIRQRFRWIVRLLSAAGAGHVASATIVFVSTAEPAWPLIVIVGLIVLACCWVLYMPFYYVVTNSMSVQTLLELDAAGGCLPRGRLEARFASPAMLGDRLRTMSQYGNLTRAGDRFQVTSKGVRTAHAFSAVRQLWRLGTGG